MLKKKEITDRKKAFADAGQECTVLRVTLNEIGANFTSTPMSTFSHMADLKDLSRTRRPLFSKYPGATPVSKVITYLQFKAKGNL